MVLNQINYKMPIYKDCTLFELLAVSIAYLVIGGMILSMITRLMFGYGSIGAAITLLTLVHVTRFVLGRLQRIKYGKSFYSIYVNFERRLCFIIKFWSNQSFIQWQKLFTTCKCACN